MTKQVDWDNFWTNKSLADTDFQATGRGGMDVVGFLYTICECAKILKLSKEDNLLDIGCGSGLISLAYSSFVNKIECIDFSNGMVERSRKNLSDIKNVTINQGSITKINAPNSSFSKILAYSVIQYLDNDETVYKAFSEINRVLNDQGITLIAANPNFNLYELYLEKISAGNKERYSEEENFQRNIYWSDPEKICSLARKAGLKPFVRKIHKRIWQSFYMYDLILTKL